MTRTLDENHTDISTIDLDLTPLGSVELEAIAMTMIICISQEVEKISSNKYAIMNASYDVKRRLYRFINRAYAIAQEESVELGKYDEFAYCVAIKNRIKHDLGLIDIENTDRISRKDN